MGSPVCASVRSSAHAPVVSRGGHAPGSRYSAGRHRATPTMDPCPAGSSSSSRSSSSRSSLSRSSYETTTHPATPRWRPPRAPRRRRCRGPARDGRRAPRRRRAGLPLPDGGAPRHTGRGEPLGRVVRALRGRDAEAGRGGARPPRRAVHRASTRSIRGRAPRPSSTSTRFRSRRCSILRERSAPSSTASVCPSPPSSTPKRTRSSRSTASSPSVSSTNVSRRSTRSRGETLW